MADVFKKLSPDTEEAGPPQQPAQGTVEEKPTNPTNFDIPQMSGHKESKTKKLMSKFNLKERFDFSDPVKKKKAIILASSLGAVSLILLLILIIPLVFVYKNGRNLYSQGMTLVDAGKSQDIGRIRAELTNTKASLKKFEKSFNNIYWTRFTPFVGFYIKDAKHGLVAATHGLEAAEILITTIEPYADIIGFTGGQVQGDSSSGEQTAEERVDFIVQSISSVIPQIDQLSEKARLANEELIQIDASKYPEKIRGKAIRKNLSQLLNLANQGTNLVINGKPLIEQLPYLLGIEGERTYFILFQNDKELRPTGGFMTAYSIAKVANGKFEPVASNDIYNLDAKYTPAVPAPDPIIDYLKGPYVLQKNLRLRDMNWAPDFEESMDLFVRETEGLGISDIDGIIAVDTQLLVYLLDAIGPIGVPGFGNFSTEISPECNCPQVIYELESFADVEGPIIWDPLTGEIILRPPNSDNRKEIIGPLMNSILANTLGQPKEKLPGLFDAAFRSLMEKHVLFYLLDDKAQEAVSEFGIAGKLSEYDGDYLHINDANLGGRKSNLYVTQEVSQEIDIAKDGTVTKTLTLTYKNPEKYDGWLNSVLPNWVRIYVPEGSELVDISGLEEKDKPYVENRKTVFAGYFELRPEGLSKVTVTYKLPFKVTDQYKMLIQKQPGTDKPLYSISAGKFEDEFFLLTDEEIMFSN